MKNIIKFFFAALVALAFAGCDKPNGPNGSDDPVLNENIVFTLEVMDVKATSAKIKVSHDGTADDTWYAFALPKTSKILEAVAAKCEELLKEESISGLKNRTEYPYTINGLEGNTDYTFIVFGLSEKGVFYGNPVSIDFRTKKGQVEMVENDKWTVEYTGEQTIGEEVYEHTATVTSQDDNTYIVTSYPKEIFDNYEISVIAEDGLASFLSYIDYINQQYNQKVEISRVLSSGNSIEALAMYPGDWYAIVIGVDARGELTGFYALSDLITIAEEEPTPDYAEWIGDWTWTGANGKSFDITFEKGISNMTYTMTGWEGVNLPVEVTWIESNVEGEPGGWAIYPNYYGELTFEGGTKGDVYLLGSYKADGTTWLHSDGNLPICLGGITEDGGKLCIAAELSDGETTIVMDAMFLMGIFSNLPEEQQQQYLSDPELRPSFPITITKREAEKDENEGEGDAEPETKAGMTLLKDYSKHVNFPRFVKTYYQEYCNSIMR